MANTEDNFELEYNDGRIRVSRHTIGGQTVFRVLFSDKRAPLVLTRAVRPTADRFWTSIPEGRQEEAEAVGERISEYFKTIS